MKFAVPYYKSNGGKWLNYPSEIIIRYDGESTEESFVTFLKEHDKQRIIIDILNYDKFLSDVSYAFIFRNLKIEHNLTNFALRFNVEHERVEEVEAHLRDLGFNIPDSETKLDYFYNGGLETFEQLDRFMYTEVSDVYITNALAFDIKRVKEKILKASHHINIRLYPNVCQSYWNTRSILSFFIRPEDISLYNDYVDVMEIYAESLPQKSKAEVYYDIYAKSGSWFGDLKEYLINCDDSIYSPLLWKNFGEKRLGCKKRCIADGKCRFCYDQLKYLELMQKTTDKVSDITRKIAEAGINVIPEENEVEDIKIYIGEIPNEDNENSIREEYSNEQR